jgi:hypothetical protein
MAVLLARTPSGLGDEASCHPTTSDPATGWPRLPWRLRGPRQATCNPNVATTRTILRITGILQSTSLFVAVSIASCGKGKIMSVREAERPSVLLVGGSEPARAHLEAEVHEPIVIHEYPAGWSVRFAKQPLAAQGSTRADAIASMIDELRLYSASWPRLAGTPEHAGNWPLAQLVAVSTAEQLSAWIEREAIAER